MDIRVIAVSLLISLWVYLSSVLLAAYVASEKALSALPDKTEEEWEARTPRERPSFSQRLGRS